MRVQGAAPLAGDQGTAASASTGNSVENIPKYSAAQAQSASHWQANAEAAERRSISRIEAAKNAPRDPVERSAQSAFDSGRHWQRPEERKGRTLEPDWVWKPPTRRANALRIKIEATTRETCICATCGERFIPLRSDAKTCSSRCRQAAYHQRKRTAVAQR